MKLKIITSQDEQLQPSVQRHFTVETMPVVGQVFATQGMDVPVKIRDVGYTLEGDELVATIWLSPTTDEWIGALT